MHLVKKAWKILVVLFLTYLPAIVNGFTDPLDDRIQQWFLMHDEYIPASVLFLDHQSGKIIISYNSEPLLYTPQPPGSLFKLVSTLTAFRELESPMEVRFHCNHRFYILSPPPNRVQRLVGMVDAPFYPGDYYPCTEPGGHGWITLDDALVYSCNVYFYNLGRQLGNPAISRTVADFSLLASMELPGISIPPGHNSCNLEPGFDIRYAIGDTMDLQIVPIRLLMLVAWIGNEGNWVIPAWNHAVHTRYEENIRTNLDASTTLYKSCIPFLQESMRRVVTQGTAKPLGDKGLCIAGKTGTATQLDCAWCYHGWFIGFLPYPEPKVSFLFFIPNETGKQAVQFASTFFESFPPEEIRMYSNCMDMSR